MDSSQDDDDGLVATQLATQPMTQPMTQPAAVGPVRDAKPEVVRCMICALNLTGKPVLARELHLNACLDAASMDTRYDCPTCGKELTDYNEQRRMAHANLCLDRLSRLTSEHQAPLPTASASAAVASASTSAATATAAPASTAPLPTTYLCRICGLDLALDDTVEARSRHVKRCGQRFGLRASDLTRASGTLAGQSPSDDPGAERGVGERDASCSESVRGDAVDGPRTERSDASSECSIATDRSSATNAFAVMMRSSATAATSVVTNAFDVLMKSSKTQAIVKATTAPSSFWRQQNSNKRQRVGSAASSAGSVSSYNSRSRYRCPDFKRILGTQPPFIVDGFQYASKALSNVYFLTHFHSDHYTGLAKSFDAGIIYCNHITAALVVQELGIDAKYVHPVPMHTPVDIHNVQVTLMDANHCPGAAIMLFRLPSGRTYLHTGDFRFHPKMWSYAALRPFVTTTRTVETDDGTASATGSGTTATTNARAHLDGVYLDTTYADPKYTFPTQEASIQLGLSLVEKHMQNNGEKVLFLFGSYSIGKERLFMEVAKRFERKVCVSRAKRKMIATFSWPDTEMKRLTMEPGATNLHVVPMHELKLETLTAVLARHRLRFRQIVAFRPTGWTFSRAQGSSKPSATCRTDPSGTVRIYGVPYSEHSSFAELCEFVRELDPTVIIPTVNCSTEKAVKKQVDLLRQTAFHSISNMFTPQP